MSNNNQNHFSPLMAALIGGVAGALAVVYFSDEKRRVKIMDKIEEIVKEGEEKGYEFKDKIDKSIKSGKKNLAKKIRQVENQVAQT
jgi:5'-deoxynucleotidase YfbR-like HD superfamily hydrolase